MLAEKIAGAEEYLAHFQTELEKQGCYAFSKTKCLFIIG